MSKRIVGVACILTAAALFGCVSLFLGGLTALGVTRMQIIMLRSLITAGLIVLLCLFKERKIPGFRFQDVWIFVSYGVINMIVFTVCYWRAMELVGVSISSILIYTAPVFALVISAVFFQERINRKCIFALVLAILGVACVSGLGDGASKAAPGGIALGIFAGFLYSLQGIWSRTAVGRGYRPWCITLYATLFCAVFSTPLALSDPIPSDFFTNSGLALIFGMALLCIMIPTMLYAKGLETIPAGRASMMTSAEPAVATLIGTLVFREQLTILAVVGIVVIIMAVCILVSDQK